MTDPCEVCGDRGIVYDVTERRMVPCGGIECTVKPKPGSLLAYCHRHGHSWDLDFDPPECSCEFDLICLDVGKSPR
jgi:hypothetical protein